jgi:Tfp pilus assembly protein PilF
VKGMENKEIMSKKKIIIVCVTVIALIAIIFIVVNVNDDKSGNDLQKLLDLGNKYIAEMDYEQAIVAFRNAIDIDPKCEDAYKALIDI